MACFDSCMFCAGLIWGGLILWEYLGRHRTPRTQFRLQQNSWHMHFAPITHTTQPSVQCDTTGEQIATSQVAIDVSLYNSIADDHRNFRFIHNLHTGNTSTMQSLSSTRLAAGRYTIRYHLVIQAKHARYGLLAAATPRQLPSAVIWWIGARHLDILLLTGSITSQAVSYLTDQQLDQTRLQLLVPPLFLHRCPPLPGCTYGSPSSAGP